MYYNEIERELSRLKFEDFFWFFYGSVIVANLFGNYYEKEYLRTHNKATEIKYNSIYEIVLILTFFIYIYLLLRNYNNYQRAPLNEKNIYLVRVFGAIFLIVGILCFIYYQDYQRRK